MTHVIVLLDVLHIHRLRHPRPLVQLTQPVGQVRVVAQAAQVALEVPVVNRIETHQRGEQPHVGLGQVFTGQVAITA
ncbi:hypothetical protein D3C76_1398540 [compost metagenome]